MKVFSLLFVTVITLFANEFDTINSKIDQLLIDLKADDKKNENNKIYSINKFINEVEKEKTDNFLVKEPKVIDIYVRGSYTIIENDYVIKNRPLWKKVLIKNKFEWE